MWCQVSQDVFFFPHCERNWRWSGLQLEVTISIQCHNSGKVEAVRWHRRCVSANGADGTINTVSVCNKHNRAPPASGCHRHHLWNCYCKCTFMLLINWVGENRSTIHEAAVRKTVKPSLWTTLTFLFYIYTFSIEQFLFPEWLSYSVKCYL